MSRPSDLAQKGPATGNPFVKIESFPNLELRKTKGRPLPDVINQVAKHMVKNKIATATVLCNGTTGATKRYFANLDVLSETMPEDFGKISSMHPLVHLQSPKFPRVVVLKAEATSRI